MAEINKYEYITKLIPDFTYIDFIERDIWSKNESLFSSSDEYKYNLLVSFLKAKYGKYTLTDDYRCLLISDYPLNIESGLLCELRKYSNRYVYACIVDDDITLRESIKFEILNYDANIEYYPIIKMRF